MIGFVLWGQKQFFKRLEEVATEAYLGLGYRVVVAIGSGENPIWLYWLNRSENSLLGFYRNLAKQKWRKLIAEESGGLAFERGLSKILICASDRNGTVLLFDSQAE